jgi:two-component system LytT family response regulator
MNNYRYIILDKDINNAEERLEQIGAIKKGFILVGMASDTEGAVELINSEEPDLILANTNLKGGNVFKVIQQATYNRFKIIFITESPQYLLQALRLQAVDYIKKPVAASQLSVALERFEKSVNEKPTFGNILEMYNQTVKSRKAKMISIPAGKTYLMKSIESLLYIKADSNCSELFFDKGEKYTVAKTLLDYEMMLESYGFFRIHQSYLINLAFLQRFHTEDLCAELTNGTELPVSVRRRTVLVDYLRSVV